MSVHVLTVRHICDTFDVPLGKITGKCISIMEHYQEVCKQNRGVFNERKKKDSMQCHKEDQIVMLDLCKLRLTRLGSYCTSTCIT